MTGEPKDEARACGRVFARLLKRNRTTAYRFVGVYAAHEYHLATVMRYTRGQRVPDPFTLRHLCEYLGVTMDQFMELATRELKRMEGE
jgi:transcriptional regulator with XRE-family HTH domain